MVTKNLPPRPPDDYPNPWSFEHWDRVAQANFYRKHGDARSIEMAAKVGATLTSARPTATGASGGATGATGATGYRMAILKKFIGVQLPPGNTPGYVLTTGPDGTFSWQPPTGGSGSGSGGGDRTFTIFND